MQISVIVPVYNVIDYLEECVESILSQTVQSYECILVDDGSTDGSGELCDKLLQTDDRIRVIHKENGGLSDARNAGVEEATGKYILFMDSDDFYVSKSCFDILLKHAEDSDADVVCFNYARYDTEKRWLGKGVIDFSGVQEEKNTEKIREHLVYNNSYQSSACIKMVKTDLLKDNGFFFEKGILSEDIEWSAKLLLSTKKITYCNDIFYAYRVRNASITHTIRKKSVLDQLYIIKKLLDYKTSDNETFFWHYVAFQYSTLILNYRLCVDDLDKNVKREIKELSYILRYDKIKEVKMIHTFYKLLGFSLVTRLLKCYFMYIRRTQ